MYTGSDERFCLRKARLLAFTLLLLCACSIGAASADHGYTETSMIPMAVDFSVDVMFDTRGNPRVVTDYPFDETGAKEMNLVYQKGDIPEAVSLLYDYPSGETSVIGYGNDHFDYSDLNKAAEAVRSGEVTLSDRIYINTNRNSAETDWILEYSLSRHSYTSYTERTHSQGFNGMGTGGLSKSVNYTGGEMRSSRILKRIEDADLVIDFSRTGAIEYASVYRYNPVSEYFDYDPVTGLFGGHRLSELGFNDSDIRLSPLAVTGETTTSVSVADDVPVTVTAGRAATRIVGGLLTGLLIGLILFRMFRGRKEEKEDPLPPAETAVPEEIPVPEDTAGSTPKYMNR